MRFKKKILGAFSILSIVLVTLTASLSTNAYFTEKETSYVITTYDDSNGLPTGEANTILQTKNGYIWIGSYGGLIKYDGTTFRNYSLEGAIDSSSIRSLFEDSQGRLWIGTNDKGIILLENNVFTTITSPDDHSYLCIRDFAESKDGKIYAASNSGIAYIDGNTLVPIDNDIITGQTVYNLDVDCYDRIWFSTVGGACGVLDQDENITTFNSSDFFADFEIYSIGCYDDTVYIGSNESMYAWFKLTSDSLSLEDLDVKYNSTNGFNTHNKICVSPDGDVMFCCLNGLYIIYSDGTVETFNEDASATSVNWSTIDYEGDVWLASSSIGVTKYAKGYFYQQNKVAKLENISLNAITKSNGYMYIGADDGLYILDENWNPIENQLSSTLDGIRVRSLITSKDGQVWISSYAGVFSYNPTTNTIKNFTESDGLLSNKTRSILELSDGKIAVGTQSGITIFKNNKIIENYTTEDGLVTPSILCMLETEDGTLLAGSDGDGIYAIKDGAVTNHSFNEGLEEGVILRMLKNSDDEGYFISAGSSLYYWNNNTFKKLTNWDKGAGSIFDMYDKQGYLWVMQNKGILAVNKEQLLHDIPAETIVYGFPHGLTGSLNANTWHYLEDTGDLYIATRNGVSVFYFTEIKNSNPKGIINSVNVDGTIYDNPSDITISSEASRITITFSSLSFSGTSTLKMSYRLEGFDTRKTILDSTKTESLSYTNLPGGDYTFILDIYDSHNPNMKERYTVNIHKELKLTEVPAFWAVCILLIIILTASIIHMISRRKLHLLEARRKEYQSIVEQSLTCFAKTIDAKDSYTNGHSYRVAVYAREIARRTGMSEYEQERIYYMGLLHDIGKIGIPDNILTKPGKLTKEEFDIIKTHTSIGGDILADFTAIEEVSNGARYHHERFDGTGYCEGKKGEEIPVVARIIGVADTYDAMSSDRCYRKALSTDVIISELKKAAGTQLDPDYVAIMLDMIEEKVVPNLGELQ